MTEPTSSVDTAALLAAGMHPSAPRRWQPLPPAALAGALPQLEILELLGAGAFGAVYKARQTHLDRLVAVKLMAPPPPEDAGFHERFAREARALARLDHPHIVTLHDFGRWQDRSYLVMQYVAGSTLRAVMATGALSGPESLRLVRQLCDALAHAHAAGVVHRDLKPENILIDARGDAHIADFGLAKLHGGGEALTGTGEVLGTAHYMAPEQLAASPIDHRADLYALGVIIYEMLTGALPLGRFDPPSSASTVPAAVDAVVLRTLERDPSRRYPTATDLATALERAAVPPAAAPTAPPTGEAAAAPAPAPPPPPPPAAGTGEAGSGAPAPAPAGGTPRKRVDIGLHGIEVQDGDEHVRIGWNGVQVQGARWAGQPEVPRPAAWSTGARGTLYAAGMTAVLLGATVGIAIATSVGAELLAQPTSHLAAHRQEDLALLAAPITIAGGVALLSRVGLPVVILSAIAQLLFVPYLWQTSRVLGLVEVGILLWYLQAIFHLPHLSAHFQSLPWRARLLRWGWALPLLLVLVSMPSWPWLPWALLHHHG